MFFVRGHAHAHPGAVPPRIAHGPSPFPKGGPCTALAPSTRTLLFYALLLQNLGPRMHAAHARPFSPTAAGCACMQTHASTGPHASSDEGQVRAASELA